MIWAIVILGFLLVLNGILAMSELAMMTSRQARLQASAAAGDRGAALALKLSREPTRFLSTVQVGITLIGIFAGAFGERSIATKLEGAIALVPGLAAYAEPLALGIVVVGITYCSLVLGELVPKRLALAYPEVIASTIARPLSILSKVMAWPVKLLSVSTDAVLRVFRVPIRRGDDVSEADVKSLVARAASTGVFDPVAYKLFQRTFHVADLRVSELMVARQGIVWIEETTPVDHVRVLIGTSPFSHFPVCRAGRGLDGILGVVHVKDLIAYGLLAERDFKVSEVASKPLFVPENTPALKMLDFFQRSRVHIAFVVDEYGATKGLLTINDVVQALVGDISRQGEATPPQITRREDGTWLVDGSVPLHELVAKLGIPAATESELPNVNTAAGLVVSVLGHIPQAGERAVWHGCTLEVMDMDGQRVDKLMVTPPSAAPGGA